MNKYIIGFLLIVVMVNTAVVVKLTTQNEPDQEIAYIRTELVIQQFQGLKDLEMIQQMQNHDQMAYADSLANELRYNADAMDPIMAMRIEQQLKQLQNSLTQEDQVHQERMMAVLGQLNGYIERYGQENNVKVILGTTSSGSLMYAEQSIDITDDVIASVNEYYNETI